MSRGDGGGQVVTILPLYSVETNLNSVEVYNFSVKLLLKTTKINKKRLGLDHIYKCGYYQKLDGSFTFQLTF